MRIAIIGAGNVGAALCRAAVKAGHEVTIAAPDPEQVAAVAGDTGATAAESTIAAVDGAEVVVLAVPATAAAVVARELASAVSGKVVVDVTNPPNATSTDMLLQRRYRGPRDRAGLISATELQQRLPFASVVKAFNTILPSRYASPTEQGTPLDAFYAGDDETAKAVVAELATSLGFRPVDAGGLRLGRSLEELAMLNSTLNARNGWSWQSGWKLVGPTVAGEGVDPPPAGGR